MIVPEYQGQGLGRVMVQTVAKDVLRRGFKAIEAFGTLARSRPGACFRRTISWPWASRPCAPTPSIPGCD
ncbi:hypothetical protein SCALM49S_00954 [Streptomyces californicus]